MEAFLQNFDLSVRDFVMILVGAGVFSLFAKVLGRSVWRPFIRLIEERERRSVGALAEARKNTEEAEILTRDYEQRIIDARNDSLRALAPLVSKSKLEAVKIIEAAEMEANRRVLNARKELDAKVLAEKEFQEQYVDNLSLALVEKVRSSLIRDS